MVNASVTLAILMMDIPLIVNLVISLVRHVKFNHIIALLAVQAENIQIHHAYAKKDISILVKVNVKYVILIAYNVK